MVAFLVLRPSAGLVCAQRQALYFHRTINLHDFIRVIAIFRCEYNHRAHYITSIACLEAMPLDNGIGMRVDETCILQTVPNVSKFQVVDYDLNTLFRPGNHWQDSMVWDLSVLLHASAHWRQLCSGILMQAEAYRRDSLLAPSLSLDQS